jgi:hypothetical protein
VNGNSDGLSVDLITGDLVNVDSVLGSVDAGDLTVTSLVGSANNKDLIILADGGRADLIIQNNTNQHTPSISINTRLLTFLLALLFSPNKNQKQNPKIPLNLAEEHVRCAYRGAPWRAWSSF